METLLIVDDQRTNLEILLGLLGEEYDILVALDGEEALELLAQEHVDLVLLDIEMPGMDGFEVCRRCKADARTRDLSVIFLTAHTDEAHIEQAYDIGGSDYITKPFKVREIRARIQRELQLQRLQRTLKEQAIRDPLTGLYNRRYCSTEGRASLKEKWRFSRRMSLIELDIDCFKQINDRYGHFAGDRVIVEVAEILKSYKEREALVARYGGEEFVMLLPDMEINEALELAEMLRRSIEEHKIGVEENLIDVTASFGVAQLDLSLQDPVEDALRRADRALYRAKEKGRNRVERAGESL